jgi:hypothetical protein
MTVPGYIVTLSHLGAWLVEKEIVDREWQDRLADADGAQSLVDDTANALDMVRMETGRLVDLSMAPVVLQDALLDLARLRGILEAFGALEPDDKTTGPLDLLEMLLPPAGGDA